MPALVAGIHIFSLCNRKEDVDGRDEPGHDEECQAVGNCCPCALTTLLLLSVGAELAERDDGWA